MPARTGRPWQRRKARIIRRDGGICHLCHQPGADTADHLIPYSQGGSDRDDNLAAAHIRCNQQRGTTPITQARQRLAPQDNTWQW